jgi:hypothetical protein
MWPITIRVRRWKWEAKKTFWIKERRLDADSSLFNHTLAPVIEMILRYQDHACRAKTAYPGTICDRRGETSDTNESARISHKKW